MQRVLDFTGSGMVLTGEWQRLVGAELRCKVVILSLSFLPAFDPQTVSLGPITRFLNAHR